MNSENVELTISFVDILIFQVILKEKHFRRIISWVGVAQFIFRKYFIKGDQQHEPS